MREGINVSVKISARLQIVIWDDYSKSHVVWSCDT